MTDKTSRPAARWALAAALLSTAGWAAEVRDDPHGYSFEVPTGYQALPADTLQGVQHAYLRGTPRTSSYGLLTMVGLGGPLAQGSALNHATAERAAQEAGARGGITVSRFEYRTLTWGEDELEVMVSHFSGNGREAVTIATQVPLRGEAVQLQLAGPEGEQAQLEQDLGAVLRSLHGASSWATSAESDRQLSFIIGLVAGGVGLPLGLGVALWLVLRRLRAVKA